jgi:hypothetical protein
MTKHAWDTPLSAIDEDYLEVSNIILGLRFNLKAGTAAEIVHCQHHLWTYAFLRESGHLVAVP